MCTTLHGLMHIWIVGAPHHMIDPFEMFQDGRDLDIFQWGEINIMLSRIL